MAKVHLFPHLLASSGIAALLIATPVTIQIDEQAGAIAVKASAAFAKDGRSGGDDSDGDSDSSGSGGDSGGDNSGRGGGDNSGDDSDDGDSSGRGRGREGGDADRGDDDDDDGRRGAHHLGPNGEKVEIEGNKIEVVYRDGYKEEIENGRFEMKDPNGRTIVERRATRADIARLRALAN